MKVHYDKNILPLEVNKFIGLNLSYAKDRLSARKMSWRRYSDCSANLSETSPIQIVQSRERKES